MLLAAFVLALALVLPMGGSIAAATVDTTVNIPAEVVNVVGGSVPSVTFRQGTTDYGPYINGAVASLNAGIYSWKFSVNNYTTPLRTGFVVDGANDLYVTAADYCKQKVVIPTDMKNLDDTPAYIIDRWNTAGTKHYNGDFVYYPMGATMAYWLTINGMSVLYNKVVDCSPLQAGERIVASYCKMQIIVPQALKDLRAEVRIYNITKTFYGGETVVLPIGQTITWYLKINGFEVPHTGKPVDCTPINVTAADYCTVVNKTGQTINIYNTITLVNEASVILPMGANIEWKYNAGSSTPNRWPGIKKTVDCTPIVSP